MKEQVYELIKVWAGKPTWHTSHPADNKRFHTAIINLREELGTKISESDLRYALKKHRKENNVNLGGKPSNEKVEEFVEKAMTLITLSLS